MRFGFHKHEMKISLAYNFHFTGIHFRERKKEYNK